MAYAVRKSLVDGRVHAFVVPEDDDTADGEDTEDGEGAPAEWLTACGLRVPPDRISAEVVEWPQDGTCALLYVGSVDADRQQGLRGRFRKLVNRPWADGASS